MPFSEMIKSPLPSSALVGVWCCYPNLSPLLFRFTRVVRISRSSASRRAKLTEMEERVSFVTNQTIESLSTLPSPTHLEAEVSVARLPFEVISAKNMRALSMGNGKSGE